MDPGNGDAGGIIIIINNTIQLKTKDNSQDFGLKILSKHVFKSSQELVKE